MTEGLESRPGAYKQVSTCMSDYGTENPESHAGA